MLYEPCEVPILSKYQMPHKGLSPEGNLPLPYPYVIMKLVRRGIEDRVFHPR